MKNITIKGARVHNLKQIDLTIPKNQLIAVTGVSGSGKSSLVFDILFEEGRKQYLQSLGMLSGLSDEPKFDAIAGLCPAIAVQQNIIRQSNPRSTVGSRTQLLNLLAVLYAGEGKINCSRCGTPVGDDLRCCRCGNMEERLGPSYFSHNAPNGMCVRCGGRGAYFEINLNKLVPDEHAALQMVFDRVNASPGYARLLQRRFKDHLETPFGQLPAGVKDDILFGHHVNSNYEKRSVSLTRIFQGDLYRGGGELSGVYTRVTCASCQGYRVGEEARRVLINGRHIGELGLLTARELHDFLEALPAQQNFSTVGKNLVRECLRKTSQMIRFRLGHLSLYREMPTLSGGEIQRLFLTSHLDSEMDSLIYILDEPTVGLHEAEKAELLKAIAALKDLGNTVIVVEHDRNTIEMAEHIIDMGPGAGIEGGRVVYQGGLAGLLRCEESFTGQYLSGRMAMPVRRERRKGGAVQKENPCLTLRHARTNNLKDLTVSIPLGRLVGIAGVSGSGKSSLIADTLAPLLKGCFRDAAAREEAPQDEEEPAEDAATGESQLMAGALEGTEHLAGMAEVSQAPIGRNMNSNPASYIGIWDKIRTLFARQPEAAERGLTAGHFSFNSQGACPACGGSGREKIWLGGDLFIYNLCKSCQGKRYSDEALSVSYRGKNIHDVLEMSVAEALQHFEGSPVITTTLKVMEQIGMGYIELGQPTPSLSGGEAQRIKLAREIGRRRPGNILYVLDEPTSGLSLYDTARLIELLDELVARENSVIVIEHDPAVLDVCDWVIELGPGGGTEGGQIIAEGTPLALKNNPESITGRYLCSR